MSDQPDNSSDRDLVRRAQAEDLGAFEELVARHRDKIYARAFSMMRNQDEALDLSQEAWVKGWQRLGQFQGDAGFGTWMTRIVINLCLDQLRKMKRRRVESLEALAEEPGGAERLMPFEAPNAGAP
jgi:RNA polymerase sigma-70 factor (ECF subfamily)